MDKTCRICNLSKSETGVIRGLLCDQCNTAIGLLKEDRVIMNKAILYIDGEL